MNVVHVSDVEEQHLGKPLFTGEVTRQSISVTRSHTELTQADGNT